MKRACRRTTIRITSSRDRGRALAALTVACGLLAPGLAEARPQWNAGAMAALCELGSEGDAFRTLAFCGGLHGDVLFLRERERDVGFGPSLSLGTAAFDDLRVNAGLSVLLPTWEDFPLVLEAGPHLRNLDEVGAFGSLFFGFRSFTFHGHYEMASGLYVTGEKVFGSSGASALSLGVRVDGLWLAIPFIFAANAL